MATVSGSLAEFLARPGFWVALLLLAVELLWLARRVRLKWRPAWPLRVLLVALVLSALFASRTALGIQPVLERAVMVVDQSDSLAEGTRRAALQMALEWQTAGRERLTSEENRLVVVFGEAPAAVIEQNGQVNGIGGRASDAAGALRLAGELLRGEAGKIILATDGLADSPDSVDAALAGLTRAGHTIEIAALAVRDPAGDLAAGSPEAPANLWAGTPFDLLVPLHGAAGTGSDLTLRINGAESGIAAEAVDETMALFRIPSLPEGMVTLEVAADDAGDPFPGNNRSFAAVQVFPAPQVLLVTASPGSAAANRFAGVLAANGIQVQLTGPAGLPTNLDALNAYRVILLDNLLSSQLSREQMTALHVFTSRLAGGIVFLGGRNSYTLGGYQGTLLEPLLPVRLEPPPRTERPPMVFQLVMDRSSSMKVGAASGGQRAEPMALAREAAMRSVEMLQVTDYLGVMTFSDEPNWDVPLREIGSAQGLRQALDAISQVRAQGGTNMYEAMVEALESMTSLPGDAPSNRHMLVLSDGQSFDGTDEEFSSLAQAAQLRGITISTIAMGEDADAELLERIAGSAKGRFYAVANADDLPRILLSESQAARSENVQAGQTSLKAGEAGHPILSGISPDQLPLLEGYNALRSKAEDGAEDVLVSSSFSDPILSVWQYGLGRVAAWTGDTGSEWTGNWQPEAEGRFWSQVVRYALVNPALGPAQVSVEAGPARLVVEAALYTAQGQPLNLADVTFTYSGPDGQPRRFGLAQDGAGVYRLDIERPPDGAYRAVLNYRDENGQEVEIPVPFSANPPAEWLPPDAAAGAANLEAWAVTTGGQVVTFDQSVDGSSRADESVVSQENAGEISGGWEWLLAALVVIWPLEIAARRRWMPWNQR